MDSSIKLNLRMFDGAGAGAGAGAAAGAAGAGAAASADAGTAAGAGQSAAGPKRGRDNPLKDVVYGKLPAAPQTQPGKTANTDTVVNASTDAQRRADFDKYISENRDLYDARIKEQMDRRFKRQGELETQLQEATPILDVLKQKYGVQDAKSLMQAIEGDSSYWEDEANDRGLTVEQLKEIKRLERENEAFRARQQDQQAREQMERNVAAWVEQSEQLAKVYPSFDLRAELGNQETGERFADLLRHGIDVKTAYEVMHKDELLSGAIGYAVQTAQQSTINNIRARGMRPSENGGGGSGAGTIVKSDPTKWSKADREEVARRAMRGEKISL